MDWVVGVAGALLVAVVVRDVFHTLFHPIGHGSIAPQVMRFVWWLLRLFRSDRRIASLTGPLGIALVVLTWGAISGARLGHGVLRTDAGRLRLRLRTESRSPQRRVGLAVCVIGDHRNARVRRYRAHVAASSTGRSAGGAVRLHAAHRRGVLGSPDLPRSAPQTRSGAATLDAARGAPSEPGPGYRQRPHRRSHRTCRRYRRSPQRFHSVRCDVLLSRPGGRRVVGGLA